MISLASDTMAMAESAADGAFNGGLGASKHAPVFGMSAGVEQGADNTFGVGAQSYEQS